MVKIKLHCIYETILFQTYVFVAEIPNCLKALKSIIDSKCVSEVSETDHESLLNAFVTQLCQIFSITDTEDDDVDSRREAIKILYFGKIIIS